MEQAALHYLHAAEQSRESADYAELSTRTEQGIACGPSDEVLGRLLALKAAVCGWSQDWLEGFRIGKKAMVLLPIGSIAWSRLLGYLVTMTSAIGLVDERSALVEAIMTSEPEPDAFVEFSRAVASAFGTLSLLGMRESARRVGLRLEQLEIRVPESEIAAHSHFSHLRSGFYHLLGADPWQAYDEAQRAEAGCTKISHPRAYSFTQWGSGMTLAGLGQHDEAERKLRECLAYTLGLHNPLCLTWARAYLMIFLAERSKPDHWDEIAVIATSFIAHGAMEFPTGTAHGALARVRMAQGHLTEAREHVEKALGVLQQLRAWRPAVYRTWIEILLRENRADAARQAAEEGLRCIESLGGSSGHSEVPLRLAIAEARAAASDMAAAREALSDTLRAIDTRAAHIPDPAARSRYLDQIPEHIRARELARAWLNQDLHGV